MSLLKSKSPSQGAPLRHTNRRKYEEIVAIGYNEYAPAELGHPAVRIAMKGDRPVVRAVAFVKNASLSYPQSWKDLSNVSPWTITGAMQTPYIAFAIQAKLATLTLRAQTEKKDAPKGPISKDGLRKQTFTFESNPIELTASIPEYIAMWFTKLFPDGRRPVAASLQVAQAASLNLLAGTPAFKEAGGTAIALYVFEHTSAIVGYKSGELVLYREYPLGNQELISGVKSQMQVDDDITREILTGAEIDLSTVLIPLLKPLFRQVELSANYLATRAQAPVQTFFLYGVSQGVHHWQQAFVDDQYHPLQVGSVLASVDLDSDVDSQFRQWPAHYEHLFMSAIGAALATLGD